MRDLESRDLKGAAYLAWEADAGPGDDRPELTELVLEEGESIEKFLAPPKESTKGESMDDLLKAPA
jgi:hypothetical protein